MKRCFICGNDNNIHKHHVYFGNPLRKISEENGFVVYLCQEHHTGSHGVHQNRELDLRLKRLFQHQYELDHSREEFMSLIGRNYL